MPRKGPYSLKNSSSRETFRRTKGIMDLIDPKESHKVAGYLAEIIELSKDKSKAISNIEKLIAFGQKKRNSRNFVQYILELSINLETQGKDSSYVFGALDILDKISNKELSSNDLVRHGQIAKVIHENFLLDYEIKNLSKIIESTKPENRYRVFIILTGSTKPETAIRYGAMYAKLIEDYFNEKQGQSVNVRYNSFWQSLPETIRPEALAMIERLMLKRVSEIPNSDERLGGSILYDLENMQDTFNKIIEMSRDKTKTAKGLLIVIRTKLFGMLDMKKVFEFMTLLEYYKDLPEIAKVQPVDLTDVNILTGAELYN